MTIDDQIKDERIQYDINREAANISALTSGKIDKYEYLTGEEILPFNQKQTIEQAKCTYFPLGKAFEKQTKTIEDQGKKQIRAIKESRKQITESNDVAKNAFNIDRSGVSHEKQKEIFNGLVKEKALELSDIKDKIDPKNLIYVFKTSENDSKDFGNYQMPLKLFDNLRDGDINPKEILQNQARFKSDLSEIKIAGKKSTYQKNATKNITSFFDLREKIIEFFRDNSFLLSEAKYKAKFGEGIKILTPKQMFQRLPIAVAQVKARNKSGNLLNEIRQIVYSLAQSKVITKKLYNNIINSI